MADRDVELEVLTTCVKDFNSDWSQNFHKKGLTVENGIAVRRFPVRKRDTDLFNEINYKFIYGQTVTEADEENFLREMVNSPELYDYIREMQDEYAAYVYIPYMFGTTYYGILACPEKAVVIPCLHEEGYAYMKHFREVFSKVRGMLYLSEPERELANRLYDLSKVKQMTIGTGVDVNYQGNAEAFRKKYHIDTPFIVYAGRKDEGKNIYTLIRYFTEYKKRKGGNLKLLLLGGGKLDLPKESKDDILDLGFVSKEDKFDACAASEFLCQPSLHESFSIVIMESWIAGRPVLVHNGCAVTRNFAVQAAGGLYFQDYYEFEGCVDYLLENKVMAEKMGQNGRKYVNDHFEWGVIVQKTLDFLEECTQDREQTL
jgi:glycosyltransferase involved in cell wall biosynthesis